MSTTDDRCSSCGNPLSPGALQCTACGRVFGEDNVCPSCHATAGLLQAADGYVCAACRAPRIRHAGSVVLSTRGGSGTGKRAVAALLRIGGIAGLALGLVSAITLAVVVPGGLGLALAAVVGGAFVGGGALMMRAGAGLGSQAGDEIRARREQVLTELARERGGSLTVAQAAQHLGVSDQEADRQLTSMADGSRVSLEINDDGSLRYDFAQGAGELRVRVDAAGPPDLAGGADTATTSEVEVEGADGGDAADAPGARAGRD